MRGGFNTEERLEEIAKRLERAEKANRAMKVWSSIGFAALMALGAGPFASNARAKKGPPAIVTATQEIDLESGGHIVASLRLVAGKPNLVFFDSAGKTVVDVGINGAALPTGHAAGIAVLDGNEDIPGTGKIRATLGVTPSGPGAGVGMGTYDGNGVLRSVMGSGVDGSLPGVGTDLFDATGLIRTGLTYDPGTNFTGFFTEDASSNNRSSVGSGVDGSYSGEFIYDAAGKLRDQTIYVPSANFNGSQSYDGAGHPLSTVGNFLVNDAPHLIEANQSFLSLSDTAGTLRVFEFQNNTNEGGIDFNPGSTTVQGSWGNP